MTAGTVAVEQVERFWSLVDKRSEGECWEWLGRRNSAGYGIIEKTSNGKRFRQVAHRVSYTLAYGQPKQMLDHLCRNRACVNPKHLEDVSNRVNILRGVGATAVNARKTHCIHGHEFTPENTYYRLNSNGERRCRACGRITHKAYRQRKLEKLA